MHVSQYPRPLCIPVPVCCRSEQRSASRYQSVEELQEAMEQNVSKAERDSEGDSTRDGFGFGLVYSVNYTYTITNNNWYT